MIKQEKRLAEQESIALVLQGEEHSRQISRKSRATGFIVGEILSCRKTSWLQNKGRRNVKSNKL